MIACKCYLFSVFLQYKMEQNIGYIVLGVVVGCILGYFVAKIWFLLGLKKQRGQAVKQSRSVVLGHVHEQFAPLLPDFPYHYKDAMFMGKGVDYIIFDGLGDGYVDQIVFMEVKRGSSSLNRNEKLIKDCIQAGRVKYEVWRV